MQVLISGVMIGSVYALVSIGLTLIYGTMDIVNFAQGSFLMLSMYTSYWLFKLFGFDPYLCLPLLAFIFFIAGAVVEKLIIERTVVSSALSRVLVTFGLMLAIENSVMVVWTARVRTLTTGYSLLSYNIYGIILTVPMLISFVTSLVFSGVGYLFLMKTDIGLALRATAQNREVAEISGVNILNIYALAFALGIMLTGVAGSALSIFYPTSPYLGDTFLIVAFIVCVIGGLGNYIGAFVGGILIGAIESVSGFLLGSGFKQLIYLVIFIIILIIRPQGLLGLKK